MSPPGLNKTRAKNAGKRAKNAAKNERSKRLPQGLTQHAVASENERKKRTKADRRDRSYRPVERPDILVNLFKRHPESAPKLLKSHSKMSQKMSPKPAQKPLKSESETSHLKGHEHG